MLMSLLDVLRLAVAVLGPDLTSAFCVSDSDKLSSLAASLSMLSMCTLLPFIILSNEKLSTVSRAVRKVGEASEEEVAAAEKLRSKLSRHCGLGSTTASWWRWSWPFTVSLLGAGAGHVDRDREDTVGQGETSDFSVDNILYDSELNLTLSILYYVETTCLDAILSLTDLSKVAAICDA